MTASTRYCTPLFLKAEPPTTGTNLFAIVCRRMPAFSISGVIGFSSRNRFRDFVVDVGNRVDQVVVGFVDLGLVLFRECRRTS